MSGGEVMIENKNDDDDNVAVKEMKESGGGTTRFREERLLLSDVRAISTACAQVRLFETSHTHTH